MRIPPEVEVTAVEVGTFETHDPAGDAGADVDEGAAIPRGGVGVIGRARRVVVQVEVTERDAAGDARLDEPRAVAERLPPAQAEFRLDQPRLNG